MVVSMVAMRLYEERFYRRSEPLDVIRWLYWRLRALRPWEVSKRRQYYRLIEAQKKSLIASGIDYGELRLYCRMMMSPRVESNKLRLLQYQADKKALSLPVYIRTFS